MAACMCLYLLSWSGFCVGLCLDSVLLAGFCVCFLLAAEEVFDAVFALVDVFGTVGVLVLGWHDV